jgi:hypothetical protein
LFTDRAQAERAYEALRGRGYESDEINVLMTDDTRKRLFSPDTELGNKAAKGAGVGGAVGVTVGAIAAAIAAVGTSIAIPGPGWSSPDRWPRHWRAPVQEASRVVCSARSSVRVFLKSA